MERRRHPRKQLIRNALLHHPQGYICPCRIENASCDGFFIKVTDTRIYNGNCVDVVIDTSPHQTAPMVAKALVVYKKRDGMGLTCESDVPLQSLFESRRKPSGNAGLTARLLRWGDGYWLRLRENWAKESLRKYRSSQ